MWIAVTSPGLLGFIGPSLLAFILHRSWSIGMNLSLDLHRTPSTATSHPTPTHHKPRATSNQHSVVNHSSTNGDHHWSSISPLMSALTTPHKFIVLKQKNKKLKIEKSQSPKIRATAL